MRRSVRLACRRRVGLKTTLRLQSSEATEILTRQAATGSLFGSEDAHRRCHWALDRQYSHVSPQARFLLKYRLEPVSGESRTSLCQHREFLPGKRLLRPETGEAFSATSADSGRQRPRCPASAAAKPRNVKDYSDGRRKTALRGTAWWGWQGHRVRARSIAWRKVGQ
jgi:hypothetical protein